MTKIAIFSTSDIHRPGRDSEFEEPISISQYGDKFYSTRKLAKAFAQEFTVYVMSNRSVFGIHDEWWIQLVGIENIHFRHYSGNGFDDKASIEAWKKLYFKLGFNPENLIFRNHHVGWPTYQNAARQFGIKLGREF